MYTFQDFTKDKTDLNGAIVKLIREHSSSFEVMTARDADLYDKQQNSTIENYVRYLYNTNGSRVEDKTSSNNKLCSAFFRRLNTQRMQYSLGNGVTFSTKGLKERLGNDFDTKLQNAGYYALIHRVSFLFWNVDHAHVFKLTEFAPLWDEETGALRAGLRYWQIDAKKPVMAVLYEEDGFTKLKGGQDFTGFEVIEPKRAYRLKTQKAPADSEPEIVGEENYTSLPIIPVYGSRLKQSTLIGMKASIDAFDLIRSGFANDLSDCSEIYWIVSNAGGMDDSDLAKFRDRLKLTHIANVADAEETSITPQTAEVPYQSRSAFLETIRNGIYEDFGALDVHTINAGATNDHIDAAYQPLDENADDYEYQIIEAVQKLLELIGVKDTPIFKRNRISNQKEQTEMIISVAQYLDTETILKKLPFITSDEIADILARKDEEETARFELENGEMGTNNASNGQKKQGEDPQEQE